MIASISKKTVQRRLDEIKLLILSNRPFQNKLNRLYLDLFLAGKHPWTVQVYQFLRLYMPAQQARQLYHPALLQAFMSLKLYPQAQLCAKALLQQNPADPEVKKLTAGLQIQTESMLPDYTALAKLSPYAASPKRTSSSSHHTLPVRWQQMWQQITPKKLEELGYYQKQKQLSRLAKPYRSLIQHQFDELMLSYLLGHTRSVVVSAGALLEFLLALYLSQHTRHTHIAYAGTKTKPIFDLTFYELLTVYTQQKILPPPVLKLCRATRVNRNYIHLVKEITEHRPLQPADGEICMLALLETLDILWPVSK